MASSQRLNNFCKTPANHNSLVLAKHLRAFRALKQLADHNDDKGMAEENESTIRLARQRSSSIQTGNHHLADPNTAPCCSLQVLTSDATATTTTTTTTTTATTALPTKPVVVPKRNGDASDKHKMLMKLTKHFEMKRKKKSLIVQKLKQRRDTKRKVKRRLLVELEEVAAFDSIVQGNTVTPKVAPSPLASNNHETAQQQTRSSSSCLIPPPKPCRLLQEIADYNGKGITEKLFRPSRRRCRLV